VGGLCLKKQIFGETRKIISAKRRGGISVKRRARKKKRIDASPKNSIIEKESKRGSSRTEKTWFGSLKKKKKKTCCGEGFVENLFSRKNKCVGRKKEEKKKGAHQICGKRVTKAKRKCIHWEKVLFPTNTERGRTCFCTGRSKFLVKEGIVTHQKESRNFIIYGKRKRKGKVFKKTSKKRKKRLTSRKKKQRASDQARKRLVPVWGEIKDKRRDQKACRATLNKKKRKRGELQVWEKKDWAKGLGKKRKTNPKNQKCQDPQEKKIPLFGPTPPPLRGTDRKSRRKCSI